MSLTYQVTMLRRIAKRRIVSVCRWLQGLAGPTEKGGHAARFPNFSKCHRWALSSLLLFHYLCSLSRSRATHNKYDLLAGCSISGAHRLAKHLKADGRDGAIKMKPSAYGHIHENLP